MTGVPTLDLGARCGVVVFVVFRVGLCLTRHVRKRAAEVRGENEKENQQEERASGEGIEHGVLYLPHYMWSSALDSGAKPCTPAKLHQGFLQLSLGPRPTC